MIADETYLDLLFDTLLGHNMRDDSMIVDPVTGEIITVPYNPVLRRQGKDWPKLAVSMIGAKRMANIHALLRTVERDQVPGDFLEAGVWRGGACIFARAVMNSLGMGHRRVWVADSFCGLPPSTHPADIGMDWSKLSQLAVPADEVLDNFYRFRVPTGGVQLVQGWFSRLIEAPVDRLSVLRLDGDMYTSTWDTLTAMYDRVSVGGFIIVDDFAIKSCAQAVDDFRRERGIDDFAYDIDWTGVYWRKSKA